LCLAALPGAHWSAITPAAPLRYWRLLEVGPGPLVAAPLRIDEWLLHVLVDAPGIDHRLFGLVSPVESAGPVPDAASAAVSALVGAWTGRAPEAVVTLQGPSRQPARAVFAAACARLGWRPFVARAADLPTGRAERQQAARLWEREALLNQAALLVEVGAEASGSGAEAGHWVAGLATPGALWLSTGGGPGDGPSGGADRPAQVISAERPSAAEQSELWLAALGLARAAGTSKPAVPAAVARVVDRVAHQFDLDAEGIAFAAARARGEASPRGGADLEDGAAALADRLWDACRLSTRGGLDGLAQRLVTGATFDDLVLPDAQMAVLADILAHVRLRRQVYVEWGMSGPSSRGLGISALFSGPSGTGKTLAAEVLANALRLDLYRIDLSQVVSKWLGETEKNLRQIFEGASRSGAVLLFDEADALFGKRSEVRDSHDRYANVEVSYLLQAMESYRGLAVLTTNMRSALDPAFLRRLRFVVNFPFPGPAERARLWQRVFPPSTPTEGLDVTKLARLSVAGGNIRQIALHAAFAAADAGGTVGMAQILRAAEAEYAKLDRPLTEAEVVGWV
jgi:hypothetical protein